MKLIPKEISWLHFNGAVLEEASDPKVPLLQRFRFLGIFSSNLDEYFRIRVATLRELARLKKKGQDVIGFDPDEVLETINRVVIVQNERFSKVYDTLVEELHNENIRIITETECTKEQGEYVRSYFNRKVQRRLFPIIVNRHKDFPELKDRSIYLFVVLGKRYGKAKKRFAIIEIPTQYIPRFVILPESEGKLFIMLLDDVIRYCLDDIFAVFDFDELSAFTIKLTRDAEIDIDLDFSESIIKKISKSLRKRGKGEPVRLVYDAELPEEYLELIVSKLHLKRNESLIPGGRYHNFKDFMDFPNIGSHTLEYERFVPVVHCALTGKKSMISVIEKQDLLLHYPYNPFDHFIDLLREASIDPKVQSIKITIYRAAKTSSVLNALINAVKNGKSVTVIVELQARFDEEANINWANRLKDEGVFVNYGVPGLKVHAKLCLITRKQKGKPENIAAVSTGNFNEDTAKIYTDHCLLTADARIADEVAKIFDFLESTYKLRGFNHLIVSPFVMRDRILKLVEGEILNAERGKKAEIIIKINNITDERIIEKLYEASVRRVRVKLIVRGMISLLPAVEGLSENISAIRIVDRFLEHSRILYFHAGGDELFFLSSADMMQRNFDKRIEVLSPVYEPSIKEELRSILDLTLRDNTKARNITEDQSLSSACGPASPPFFRSQTEIRRYIEDLNRKKRGCEKETE